MNNYQISLFENSTNSSQTESKHKKNNINFRDKTGKKYGKLTVIKIADPKISPNKKYNYWWCECSCQKKCVLVSGSNLREKDGTRSCGCLTFDANIKKIKDKTGRLYGRLKVIKLANPKIIPNNKDKVWWWCECSCQKKCCLVNSGNLKEEGGTRSCGCLTFDGNNQRTVNSDLVIGKTVGFLTISNELRWEELPENIKEIYKKTKGNFLETKCTKCNRKRFLTLTLLGQLRKDIESKESQYMGCDWCSLSDRSINYSGKKLGPWQVLDKWRRIDNPRRGNTGKGPETILEWLCKCTLCNETESWIKTEVLSHIKTKKDRNRGIIGCGCQKYKITRNFGHLVDQTSLERYYNAKKRAAEKGLDFNIDPTDCIAPKYCPILGVELKSSNKGFDENSPSLDRFYPSKGYIKGNVQVISLLANRMKNDGTPEDWIKIANWVKSKDIMKKILGDDQDKL